MSHNCRWLGLALVCLGGVIVLAGCGPKNYKKDADERVYDIIDRKWDSQFGSRANYRVSDVTGDQNAVEVENAVPASGMVSLPHALAMATAHNRQYQTEKEILYTSALDLRLVRHGYETQLFGGGSLLYFRDDQGESLTAEANVGFNRLLATGTQIGTRVAIACQDVLSGGGDGGLAGVFTAVVAQPLLRGSDPRIVLERLTQAERNTLYQIRTFNRFRKTFAVAVATQYFRALELYDVVRNTQEYYDALAGLHAKVVRLVESGMLPRLEADRLAQEMLKARDILIIAMKDYEQALDELKIALALPPTVAFRLDVGLLDALRDRGIPYPEFVLDEAVETGLTRRLDITNSADAVLDAQRAVYVAADSLRADLRIKGAVDITTRGDRAAAVGPVLDLPLDRVPEQHAYRLSLLALERQRREYDQLADTIRLQVRTAYRKLTEAAERHQVLTKAVEQARERIARNSVAMQHGLASSRRVLSAHEDLYEARKAATDALIDYAIASLEFYRDTGVLQVRPDGIWQVDGPKIPVVRNDARAIGSEAIR